MGSSQSKQQEKALKAQAKETRRQAGIYQNSAMKEAKDVTTDSNASLAQAVSLLGKTGSLGVSSDAKNLQDISTGIDTGDLKGETYKKVEKSALEKGGFAEVVDQIKESGSLGKAAKDMKANSEAYSVMSRGLDDIGDISTGTVGDLTSGSTALNLKTFQDKLTKARNRFVNQAQEDVYSALMNAENAESQARLAGNAAGWETAGNILNIATSAIAIAGLF